jgi:hypothetical protein
MDPMKVCREWSCNMVRTIPDAKQVIVSEFSESSGPKVHTFRLNADQWHNITVRHYDAIERIEAYARTRDYEMVKADLKWYASAGNDSVNGIDESCIKFKRMTPSQWYLKHCYSEFSSPDAASVKAAAFAEAWGAAWGTIEQPEFVFGSDSIIDIYAECGREGSLVSCMTDMCRTPFVQIYGTSKRCCIAVLRDNGEIVERALMFLPDIYPEDTPPGPGWHVGRIYPGDTMLSRSRMGPWFAANGVKSLRAVSDHLVVSGFELLDDLYLPYLDIGCFTWTGTGEPGTQVTWHHNIPREVRNTVNHYPGTWCNDYQGGPLATPPCRCCDCGEAVDEDDVVYPTDSEPWCRDCCDNRYTWCEISGNYVSHDDMIPVHECSTYEYANRDLEYFYARRTYRGDRIEYRRVELACGDLAFVPASEIRDDRWIPDMQENDWVLVAELNFGSRTAWQPHVLSNDEDDWGWEYPGDSSVVHVHTDPDDPDATMPVRMSGYRIGQVRDKMNHLGLRFVSLRGTRLGIADASGNMYDLLPILSENAASYVDAGRLNYDNIDVRNEDHMRGLDGAWIMGWEIVPQNTNTNTADTAETASNQ